MYFFPFPIGVRATADAGPPRQLPGSREAAKTVLHSKAKIEYFVIVLHPSLG